MSVLSDLWDTGKTFVKDNSDWLKPVVSTVTGALKQNQIDNTQSQYMDYLRQREQQNYQDSVAAINAYNAQLGQGNGNRGDGGAAAAARANQAAQMKAAKKANKVSQKTYKEILKIYEPYRQTADRLLPQMTQTYEGSLGLQNAMAQYIQRPEQVAKLDAAGPAWMINVPLPDAVRLK